MHFQTCGFFLFFFEVVSPCHGSGGDGFKMWQHTSLIITAISAHTELYHITLLQNAACEIAYIQLYRQLYQYLLSFQCTLLRLLF